LIGNYLFSDAIAQPVDISADPETSAIISECQNSQIIESPGLIIQMCRPAWKTNQLKGRQNYRPISEPRNGSNSQSRPLIRWADPGHGHSCNVSIGIPRTYPMLRRSQNLIRMTLRQMKPLPGHWQPQQNTETRRKSHGSATVASAGPPLCAKCAGARVKTKESSGGTIKLPGTTRTIRKRIATGTISSRKEVNENIDKEDRQNVNPKSSEEGRRGLSGNSDKKRRTPRASG
jgi:hypothetical protein